MKKVEKDSLLACPPVSVTEGLTVIVVIFIKPELQEFSLFAMTTVMTNSYKCSLPLFSLSNGGGVKISFPPYPMGAE